MQNMYVISFITFEEGTRTVESGGGINIYPPAIYFHRDIITGVRTVRSLFKHPLCLNKHVVLL